MNSVTEQENIEETEEIVIDAEPCSASTVEPELPENEIESVKTLSGETAEESAIENDVEHTAESAAKSLASDDVISRIEYNPEAFSHHHHHGTATVIDEGENSNETSTHTHKHHKHHKHISAKEKRRRMWILIIAGVVLVVFILLFLLELILNTGDEEEDIWGVVYAQTRVLLAMLM